MASIQKRVTKEGRTTYRALIRIKGCPTRSATFDRRSDARRWSQKQEEELLSTRLTCSIKNEQHTLGELVDRYVLQVMPDKKDIAIQTHQLKVSLFSIFRKYIRSLLQSFFLLNAAVTI